MHDGQNKTSLTGLVMRPVVAPWYFARQNSKHCIQRHHLWRIYRKKNPCCTHKQELAAETQEGGPKSGLLRPCISGVYTLERRRCGGSVGWCRILTNRRTLASIKIKNLSIPDVRPSVQPRSYGPVWRDVVAAAAAGDGSRSSKSGFFW